MKLAAIYSHLNGLEWLQFHHPEYWEEIQSAITDVDAEKCKVKVSQEKTMPGKLLYSPTHLNTLFKEALTQRKWANPKTNRYYVSDDHNITTQLIKLPLKEQRALLESLNKPLIETYNAADFEKDRISVEVQFGKYFAVQFDLFIKHASNYMQNRIDLGVEIVPTKKMERDMSSGPPYFEKHLHEILRQGRVFPPVPLVLIGVEP